MCMVVFIKGHLEVENKERVVIDIPLDQQLTPEVLVQLMQRGERGCSVMKSYIYGIYNITAASMDRYLQLNGWTRNYDFANPQYDGLYEAEITLRKTIAIPAN